MSARMTGHQPQGSWMVQVARNLTDVGTGFLGEGVHLIQRAPAT